MYGTNLIFMAKDDCIECHVGSNEGNPVIEIRIANRWHTDTVTIFMTPEKAADLAEQLFKIEQDND